MGERTTSKDALSEAEKIDAAVLAPRMRPYHRALPISLLRAREKLMQRFRPLLLTRGITDQQWRIIRALADVESTEILHLSELCVIHPASLSRILPKMEAAGMITRRTNSADKRRVIVALTEAGRTFLDDFGPESEAIYETITQDVGIERLQEFYTLLDEVIDALSSPRRGADA
jgi:homoprotocatechuate degradation regulator HpaR